VRTLLQARQKTLTALKQREADAEKERTRLIKQRKTLNEEIERLETELDALGEEAKTSLASDPTYSAKAERLASLQSMVEQASAKAEKAHTEEVEKGAPYRNDPLFIYLWERKYGTSDYDVSGLVRALDGWVARLIDYQDARANFAVLTQIPERLAAHVERLQAMAEKEQDALEAMEAEKIKELDEHDAELERRNAELLETGKQLKTYAEGHDPSFQDAVKKTADFLESRSLNVLREETRRTPEPGDDQILAVIEKLANERSALETLAQSRREALEAAFKRKEELLRIAAEFRRSGYDRPGSVFEPEGTGEALLKLLLQGAITAAEYWLRTQGNHRRRRRPADGYRRRESGSFGGRRRRGSSSRGPDFRTGGGF